MKRVPLVLTILVMLAVPMAWTGQPAAGAGDPITIHAVERGSGDPVLYACYTLADLDKGGSPGGGCDGKVGDGDGLVNGTVVVTPGTDCPNCEITQRLPDQPNDQPTDYLLDQPQVGASGQTYTFQNYLKPYIVVTMIKANSGKKFKGACIGVSQPDVAGSGMGICDGNPNGGDADKDLKVNGKIKTKRLPTPGNQPVTLTYKVEGKTPFFEAKKAVTLQAEPAKTGEFEKATLKFRRIS